MNPAIISTDEMGSGKSGGYEFSGRESFSDGRGICCNGSIQNIVEEQRSGYNICGRTVKSN